MHSVQDEKGYKFPIAAEDTVVATLHWTPVAAQDAYSVRKLISFSDGTTRSSLASHDARRAQVSSQARRAGGPAQGMQREMPLLLECPCCPHEYSQLTPGCARNDNAAKGATTERERAVYGMSVRKLYVDCPPNTHPHSLTHSHSHPPTPTHHAAT